MASPLVLAFAIGFIAGLRSMTAPAAVCFAAQVGWIDLHQSPLAFMGSPITAWIFGLFAVGELILDKLPFTPSRLAAGPLAGRFLLGGLAGATILAAASPSFVMGAIAGAIGGLAGAFAGYHARVGAVKALHLPDFVVALAEDAIAIVGALFIVSKV
jgi:uncharacterized membrane protein